MASQSLNAVLLAGSLSTLRSCSYLVYAADWSVARSGQRSVSKSSFLVQPARTSIVASMGLNHGQY